MATNRKGKITIELDYEIIPDYADIMLELSHPLLDGSMHCIYSNMKEVESALEELVEGDEEDGEPLPPHVDEVEEIEEVKTYKYNSPSFFSSTTVREQPYVAPAPEPKTTLPPNTSPQKPSPKRVNTSAEQISELTEKGIGLVLTLNTIFGAFFNKGK